MVTILVLCTGNSCRSIMLEGLLQHLGKGRVRALSAGSKPTGTVHPLSLATLEKYGLPLTQAYSKSWDVFHNTPIDLIITVCDNAAGEACPLYGQGILKTHWGVPDPAHGTAADFEAVFSILKKRTEALLALPAEQWTTATLAAIGALR